MKTKATRVLYVVPETADIGGIAPSSEQIMMGLKEVGFEAEFMYIRTIKHSAEAAEPRVSGYEGQWVQGEGTGQLFHPMLGWRGYGWSLWGANNIARAVMRMNEFDVVIWGAAFGFNVKWYHGRHDWLDLFTKVTAKKVIMHRDDHLWDSQDWYAVLDKYVDGWACVHRCSFDMSEGLTKPRAIIPSPHDVSDIATHFKQFGARRGVLSVQNAKSWKNVDAIVRAAPYLQHHVMLAGDGLVIRNMQAEIGGKLKPGYMVSTRKDPDARAKDIGKRIWDVANASKNFEYLGPINEQRRDQIYKSAAFGMDLSLRANTGQFNRVFIEAAKHGCVTIATEQFMSGVNRDNFLQPMKHYLPINIEVKPKAFAEQLAAAHGIQPKKYREIQETNRALLYQFDRKKAAEDLVKLALGQRAGWQYAKGDPSAAKAPRYLAGCARFVDLFGGL
jgi:hypothetical protein